MKKPLKLQMLALLMIIATVIFFACGKPAETVSGSSAASSAPSVSALPSLSPSPSPDPPQKVFIAGAKSMLSTDITKLLTEKEDGTPLVGMLSDILYDLNNSTAQSDTTITLSDIATGKKKVSDKPFISLDTLHDAKSGNSSLEVSAGLGTENAKNAGIYITGNAAVLKPGSPKDKILLYTMPAVPGAATTFFDKASILLTGLLSADGKAQTLGSNLVDRQALCDRYLDPWLKDTTPEDYTDGQITKTLAGKDVPLRSVTLNMTGQRAYDFVLGNMQKLQTDVQFAGTDRLLGGIMGLMSSDLVSMITSLINDGNVSSAVVTSAVGKLVGELQALTPAEKEAAKFTVSIFFNGDKPIGIYIEAGTTGKVFQLGAILYRSGLEHELDLHYRYLDGTSVNIALSTVSTGGDNFDVTGKLQVTDSTGLETYSGGYTGKLAETAAKYDLTGTINLTLQFIDGDKIKQKVAVGGDLVLGITHDDSGYTGTGSLDISMTSPADDSSFSAKIQLDAKLLKLDAVTIKPPLYTDKNVTTITNKQDLWAIHASALGDMNKLSQAAQDLRLVLFFLLGS